MSSFLPFENIEREILVKKESKSSDKFGCYPENRTVEELLNYGVVNLDKPAGPTSHQVSAYTQKVLGVHKSGHSGTLDPLVTGVLPIAIGKATKIVQLLLLSGKEYIALMHIHKKKEEYDIYKAVNKYVGTIKQMPPVKSAVKRQWRERKVYYIDIVEIKGQDILFKVGCEAGTYIRKLIHDIGTELGCGAHMQELRRTKVAMFNEDTIVTLQDLADAYHFWKDDGDETKIRKAVQPIENACAHVPKIWVFDTAVDPLCNGANLAIPGISKLESGIEPQQMVAIFSLKNELICYGRAALTSEKMMELRKGMAVKTEKVFMPIGTYPKMERLKQKEE
jgi:H/ACA ribonucleoprotein complex subunit 4